MSSKRVKAGIVGATGYAGEELIDILLRHPEVEITYLAALVEKETDFSSLYPRFSGRISLKCKKLDAEELSQKSDLIFLALPHTESMKVAPLVLKRNKRVIDLSADYRLPAALYKKWYGAKHVDEAGLKEAVYGLPELNRASLKKARLVANPGCYPTSVIIALLPIVKMISEMKLPIVVDSKSGVTGAGRKASVAMSFGEVDENFKCYKANEHQHMPEMEHILSREAAESVKVNFAPHLLPIRRGILSTIYVPCKDKALPSQEELYREYENYYKNEVFVRLHDMGSMPEIKDVAFTNFCDIGLKKDSNMLIIVSAIDNLLKGASGQAVQNLNIMHGFKERAGLL